MNNIVLLSYPVPSYYDGIDKPKILLILYENFDFHNNSILNNTSICISTTTYINIHKYSWINKTKYHNYGKKWTRSKLHGNIMLIIYNKQ